MELIKAIFWLELGSYLLVIGGRMGGYLPKMIRKAFLRDKKVCVQVHVTGHKNASVWP